MKDTVAFLLFIFGLLLTMGGVGGVENSLDNVALLSSTLIAMVGLGIMYCGVLALNVNARSPFYYD